MNAKLLLDSHVFLWLAATPDRVGSGARKEIEAARNVYFSPVSIAEICIKSALGKLSLPAPIELRPAGAFRTQAEAMGVTILPLDVEAAAYLKHLPRHHGDPFDRLLVAQCLVDELTLVTHDRDMVAYERLDILWT
jgi:PIN domain nuclease of toxin-antitoxin system